MNVIQIGFFIILFLVMASFLIAWFLSSIILKPKIWNYSKWYQDIAKTKKISLEYYDSLEKEEFSIVSSFGYSLSCVIFRDEISSKEENKQKFAVLCHGYTRAKISMLMYAKMLMELGFTVLAYDHRNHGESGRSRTTMGYYERQDLKTILDFVFEQYGNEIKIVTLGESMGAATVLSHLAIDDRVVCAIADCGYSNLRELLKHQLNHIYHIPAYPVLWIANLIMRVRGKFWLKDVCPRDNMLQSKTPILFIHGDADDFVPTQMSEHMFEVRNGKKDLYLCKGAKHAMSIIVDYELYCKRVSEFIMHNY